MSGTWRPAATPDDQSTRTSALLSQAAGSHVVPGVLGVVASANLPYVRRLPLDRTRLLAVAGGLLLGGTTWMPAAAQRPDLSGRWTYSAAESDNPRNMMQRRDSAGGDRPGGYPGMRGGRGGFGGGRGGFGGGRGGGGGGGGGMSDEQRARMRQTMELAFQPPTTLTIASNDSTVTFTPDSGAALVIYGDGRKLKQSVEGGGDVEIKGHWQGNDFVVERKVSGGGKVSEDYLRSQDGTQLYVIVSSDGGRGRTIEFRRVYDRAASGAPAP